MAGLDVFMPNVVTQDTRKRIQAHGDLIPYLSDPHSSLSCSEIEEFIGGLVAWVNCSNYKISLNGLEVLCLMVDRMGENFKHHVTSVLPAVIDRLGDSKDVVRDQAQQLLLKLMMPATSPQYVFERIMSAFNHKLWHVREGVLICLVNTLNTYGSRCLTLSKIVPSIVKLLDDQNTQVRDMATNALCEIYRHIGERVRHDLAKKGLSHQRLNQIYARFDEMKNSGDMLATADYAPTRGDDEVDFSRPVPNPGSRSRVPSSSVPRAPSRGPSDVDDAEFARPSSTKVPQAKRAGMSSLPGRKTSAGTVTPLRRRRSMSASAAGGVDEDIFMKQFEDVPKVQIFSPRDVSETLIKIRDKLNDPNHPWEKRVEALKNIRGVIIAGGAEYDDFFQLLRTLEPSMNCAVKDLRSQVVREACISLAYLSQQLGIKMDHMAESVLPNLIQLVPNSAKVMASSGSVCIKFIIQYTHSNRLIPVITSNLTSKSAVIRKALYEVLNDLLHHWPTHVLEKYIANVQDAIKRGISDADSEARTFARKCFWGFAEHFKDQADALLNTLEPAKVKAIQGEISGSSSNNSLNSAEGTRLKPRQRSTSQDRANYESSTLGRLPKKKHSRISSARSDTGSDLDGPASHMTEGHKEGDSYNHITERPSLSSLATPKSRIVRSNSDVNVSNGITSGYATTPAKRRSPLVTAALSRMAPGATSSLPRQKSSASSVFSPPERSRQRGRSLSSQSQPGSRSTSPSSRLAYLTHTKNDPMTPGRPRRSGIPRSQGASREGSPNRLMGQPGRERRFSGSKLSSSTKKTNAMAQRMLRPDLEDAVADALSPPKDEMVKHKGPMRRRYDYDSDDAASETSSVCSERSYSSLGRSEASSTEFDRWYYRLPTPTKMDYYLYGPTHSREIGTTSCSSSSPTPFTYHEEIQDTAEIITLIGSGSYTDRKEGLIALQNLLRSHRYLNRAEIRKVMDVFSRMFNDPHSKVVSLFLDTLVDLIQVHARDLNEHLHMILTRLINKTGAEMLGSVQNKVHRALEAVRECFPVGQQFGILCKIITDQTQISNLKVKVQLLNYMHGVVMDMDAADFVNSADTRLVVSRVINFTTEPKSAEVRKSAQSVLIALFNLNPPELSVILSLCPKAFQDMATKILHKNIRSPSVGNDVLSPRSVISPPQNRSRPPSRSDHHDEAETENMNPEDIYDSIKKASADIQNLSFNSKFDNYDDVRKKRDFNSQDSGIQDLRNDSPDAVDGRKAHYNPSQYQDEGALNGFNRSRLATDEFEDRELFNEAIDAINLGDPWRSLLGMPSPEQEDLNDNDIISSILTELSNHNERNDERKNAMLSLIRLTREEPHGFWEEHFKAILLILLETLGDNDGQIRALALRVLREILRKQTHRFRSYTELTILRILDAHKDSVREVIRSAEECADTLANYIPPEQNVNILNPIIKTAQYPINYAAIKMMNKVVERLPKDTLENLLADIIPGLLRGYDDQQSTVRKAAVFCLVTIYLKCGEVLWNHLTKLSYSKLKLLNLYIKRAQQTDSKTASPDTADS